MLIRCGVAVVAVGLVVLSAVSAVEAQSLGQAVSTALSGAGGLVDLPCRGLQNTSALGPQLKTLCTNPFGIPASAGAEATTGSFSVDTRLSGTDEERRILQRLKELRDERLSPGASADMPGALRGLSFFVAGDHQSFDKDATSLEPGYDRETWGVSLGGDYSFGGRGVLGLALNYSNAKGSYDVGGGGFEIDTYGLTLYGSVLPARNFFVDAYAGYNIKDYASDRRIALTIVNTSNATIGQATGAALGHTGGEEIKAGVMAGYDFVIRNVTIGPRAGVNYRDTVVQGFTERGATGTELTFDHQYQTSLTSVLGLFSSVAISTGFGVLIPQVTGEYLHEFENDQKSLKFHFAQDFNGTPLVYRNDPPDRDYFMVGAGLVMVLPRGLAPFANYRELLGYKHQSNHMVTAGVRFSF